MALVRSDFKKWPILCLLEEEFISKIYMVLVFGVSGDNAIMMTVNKMVYVVNNDHKYFKKNDSPIKSLVPHKIEALCGKNIKTFAHRMGSYILALTEQGEVYRLRYNPPSPSYKHPPPTKIEMNGNCTVDIACGYDYFLALTNNKMVYRFQDHGEATNVSLSSTFNISLKMIGLKERIILCITCGRDFNMLLTDIGNVYGWGNNSVGQLGITYNKNMEIKNPIKIAGLLNIVKIACGYSHTLALDDKGELYVWGDNSHGQLGLGNLKLGLANLKHNYPTKLNGSFMGKILDVAAMYNYNLSAAINENRCVFVWGECCGHNILEPKATLLTQLHEVFFTFTSSKIMYKPLLLCVDEQTQIFNCLKNAFNDRSTSDLTIEVNGKAIYVHKAVLKMRSEYFRTLPQEYWNNNKSIIKFESFSYDVFKAFLKYLYTGDVDLPQDDMLDLMILANMYLEDRLESHCMKKIKNNMTNSNVFSMYRIARNKNLEDLKDLCFKFIVNNMTALVNTQDFATLTKETILKIIKEAAKVDVF